MKWHFLISPSQSFLCSAEDVHIRACCLIIVPKIAHIFVQKRQIHKEMKKGTDSSTYFCEGSLSHTDNSQFSLLSCFVSAFLLLVFPGVSIVQERQIYLKNTALFKFLTLHSVLMRSLNVF